MCKCSSFILGWLLNVDGVPPLSAGDDSADTDSVMYGCSTSYIGMYLLLVLIASCCNAATTGASHLQHFFTGLAIPLNRVALMGGTSRLVDVGGQVAYIVEYTHCNLRIPPIYLIYPSCIVSFGILSVHCLKVPSSGLMAHTSDQTPQHIRSCLTRTPGA